MSEQMDGLASRLRFADRMGKLLPLPRHLPSLEEAYAIQREIQSYSRLPVMVWKLGLTAEEPRAALGAQTPAVGRLSASAIYSDRSTITFSGSEMFAEAELVFEMARDLPDTGAPYTRETVSVALKGIYAGIEIARSRFVHSDLPLSLLVADNVMGHGLLLGTRLSDRWEDQFAEMPVILSRNGESQTEGSTSRVMGNPLDALVWLANWLCEQGEGGLKREQLVASGTCTGVTEIFPGDTVSASFVGREDARVSLCG
jgi:2-keto-4-pentenoate hydratase